MKDETLFNLALDRPVTERAAFMKEACGDDHQLRQRVEALIAAHENPQGFLGTPCLTPPTVPTDGLHPQATIDLSFLQASARSDTLGRLDHYEILEVVGSGGFGVVLKAFDEKLHRMVAIKVLAPELAASATARKRFVREARAAAAVNHESIVGIHAVEETGPAPYLVMEFVAGTSLEGRLKKEGPLEAKGILRIALQAAQGLAAAHRQGLVHRDIKPANILLENGVQRVKLTDFGLARTVDDASVTQTGVIAGTPSYMSPEQARGEMVDHRSDLFSLGCVFYAMCTGHSPFRAETTIAAIRRVCDDNPRPIVEVNPEIPPAVVMIIDRLLSKNPDDRFQSAEEVASLLQRQLAAVGQASSPPLKSPKSQRPASRARRWPIAVAAIVLIGFALTVTDATGVTGVGELMRTILRIQTPVGTLEVEVNDPDVQVTIEGDGGLVINGAGPQEVKLRPGSYRLRAARDGKPIPLEKELVTIERGGKQVVRVRMEDEVGRTANAQPDDRAWVQLFNAKDLSGWKVHPKQPGNWRVEDGQLVGDAPMDSHLFSMRGDYHDFHLRAETKINQMGKGGVFFRSEYGLGNVGKFPVGLQASIYNGPHQRGSRERETETTGSLYWRSGYSGILVPNEDWFTLEIIARGPKLTIKVNGVTTTAVSLNPDDEPDGHIALMQRQETVLRFRKIEIKDLTASAKPAVESVPKPAVAGAGRKVK